MKKVLSVLLAAAMACGMSVSSFALTFDTTAPVNTSDSNVFTSFGDPSDSEYCYHGEAGTNSIVKVPVTEVAFANYFYINNDYSHPYTNADLEDAVLNPGDVLSFIPVWVNHGEINWGVDVVEKHWSINIKANEYVKDAYFDHAGNGTLVVMVELDKELDEIEIQEIALQLYIADNFSNKTREQSKGVELVLPFDNYKEEYVSFDFTNDVDYAAKWIVKKNTKGTAVFDFEDAAYFTVKMIPEEEVVLNFSQDYDKAIDKEYNEYDADLEFYNFKGSKDEFTKVGKLFIPAKADTFIYEVVDGELVEVDAEYDESYTVDGFKAKKGWVIETKELGYYVVADEELVVAEEEVEAEVEADKANPETGAADFVGAAVAMAVVSVAAAGALALKK